MPVKILLNGSNGRMGRAISDSAAECGCEIAAACDIGSRPEDFIENCDVAVDFSFREATAALAELCAKFGKPLVIGTTGHTTEQRAKIESFSKIIPIVWAGNYSLGVNLLNHLAKIAATTLDESYDIEIVEMHHRHKKDAPSGTAEKLKEIVCACRNVGEDKVCYGRHGQVGERPVARRQRCWRPYCNFCSGRRKARARPQGCRQKSIRKGRIARGKMACGG